MPARGWYKKNQPADESPNRSYDAELNAVFVHRAGDSRDDGVIRVYRYKTGR